MRTPEVVLGAVVVAVAVAVAVQGQPEYDHAIAVAHTGAAANRRQLLASAWQFSGPAPPGPPPGCNGTDVCHARKCIHCGCHRGTPPCPPAPGPPEPAPGPFAHCPDQVQCDVLPTAQVALFNNNNATNVATAHAVLEACFANTSSDWWRMTFDHTNWSGPPLENAYSVAVFTMFNSRSRWVVAGTVAALSPTAERGMQQFWLKYAEACAANYPGEAAGIPLRLHDSENIDTVRHTACYFGAATLALDPTFANRTLPDNTTVYETAIAWEAFSYGWLKAKAVAGFFTELGSSGYWSRTWPCIWALHTLSGPGSRVQARAKMFIDLAMLEEELSSVTGVRAGSKSRDKKAECPTCSSQGSDPALAHHMYTALTPELYGDHLNGPVGRLYSAPISTMQLGDYQMGNVSVLVHRFGAAPETNGVFSMKNRLLGQLFGSSDDAATCSEARCNATFRPYPCSCWGGGSWHPLVPRPRQIHVVSRTPAYGLSGVVFNPHDAFVANCQQRGTGLVFANDDHSAVALPHLTGEKWGLVEDDLMMVQRCGSCNYGGGTLFQVYNATAVWADGGWWFMEAGPAGGKPRGWAAMRPAWDDADFANTTAPTARLMSGTITPRDTWAPLLLIAGAAEDYDTRANFSSAVLAAPLRVENGTAFRGLTFGWRGRSFGFTAGPSIWKGQWTLPTIDGVAVDIDPDFAYRSPHLNAAVGGEVVTASYKSYSLVYNFSDDTISRG